MADWLKFIGCASIAPALLLLAWAFPIPAGHVETNCIRWHYAAEFHVTVDLTAGSSGLLVVNPVCDAQRAYGIPSAYTSPNP